MLVDDLLFAEESCVVIAVGVGTVVGVVDTCRQLEKVTDEPEMSLLNAFIGMKYFTAVLVVQ